MVVHDALRRMRPAARHGWLLLALSGAACSFGPDHLEDGHLSYNAALRDASDRELFLNIIRLRYLETIEFVAVNSISSQIFFTASVGGTFGTEFAEATAVVVPEVAYSTRPTFTFTPQRGHEFADRFIAPMELRSLTYMGAAGWDIEIILRLLVQRMNGVTNEVAAVGESGVAVESADVRSRFNQVAKALKVLQLENRLQFGFVEQTEVVADPVPVAQVSGSDVVEAARAGYRFRRQPDQDAFVLTSSSQEPVVYMSPEGDDDAILEALQLEDEGKGYFDLRDGAPVAGTGFQDTIYIDTRSVADALGFLTQGVEIPEEHLEEGITFRENVEATGIADFFRVRVSEDKPDATLAVKHRGYWFFVAETDLRSRATFQVLAEIVRLQFTPGPGQTPVLTLPVGG